jgi:hypothetical protein
MQASRIIVWRILPLLTDPLLCRFLSLARRRRESWAQVLTGRIRAMTLNVTPETWFIEIDAEQAPAIHAALSQGTTVLLWHLLREPQDRTESLPCLPLLLVHGDEEVMLPDPDTQELRIGDRLLFCAAPGGMGRMAWILFNPNALDYIATGNETPDGYIWRWLSRRRLEATARQANVG